MGAFLELRYVLNTGNGLAGCWIGDFLRDVLNLGRRRADYGHRSFWGSEESVQLGCAGWLDSSAEIPPTQSRPGSDRHDRCGADRGPLLIWLQMTANDCTASQNGFYFWDSWGRTSQPAGPPLRSSTTRLGLHTIQNRHFPNYCVAASDLSLKRLHDCTTASSSSAYLLLLQAHSPHTLPPAAASESVVPQFLTFM